MKSLTRKLTMHTAERMAFVNITAQVEKAVADAGVVEGLCLVNAMHITASVFIRRSGLRPRRAEAAGRSR